MILYVRLKVLKKTKLQHFKLAERYFKFLSKRSKTTHKDITKRFNLRKNMIFKV